MARRHHGFRQDAHAKLCQFIVSGAGNTRRQRRKNTLTRFNRVTFNASLVTLP
jgi:hypothetical protein